VLEAWRRLPRPVRDGIRAGWAGFAVVTSRARLLPDFVIIGTQRGGTTSLYRYLTRHPGVRPAITKELRYFDLNYARGPKWYRSRFPSAWYRDALRRVRGSGFLTGESSPDYMFHPLASARVAATVPGARLIVLLRNPVDRAYSHYWHQVNRGFETLSFEEAVAREPERLGDGLQRIAGDDLDREFERHHHSYLARGAYADQIERWLDRFPPGQLLVARSEDFFSDPADTFRRVTDFLGLERWEPSRYERYNTFTEGTMPERVRARLVEHFRPHNERLRLLLDRDFGWDV
jgi:hypothetical protein